MSNAAGEQPLGVSVFAGTEQRTAFCDFTHANDSFNVEFVDGVIAKRLGRQKVFTGSTVRPSSVFTYTVPAAVQTLTDVTASATDGNTTVSIATDLWNITNATVLYVGAPFRFNGVRLTLLNPLSANTTISIRLMARGLGGINSYLVASVTDGTAVGGFTLKQTGTISWNYTDWAGAGTFAWSMGGPELLTGPTMIPAVITSADLYIVAIQIDPVGPLGTGGDVAEVSLTMTDRNNVSCWSESAGMTEYVTKNGKRMLVSSNQFPSVFNDTTFAGYAESRVVAMDLGRGDLVPIRLPPAIKSLTSCNRQVSYATFNGWLIGATTAGQLWKYDGTTCSLLESLPGEDVVNRVVGAGAYTAAPIGTMLEVYRNRLAVTGNSMYPMQFQLSLEDNNISIIPSNATVGGPNVWPLRYVFNVPGKQGDKIMGASVINDRYCILTRNQLWVYDDQSLKLSNSDIGCAATGSVCRIDNSIYFLSDGGVCTWDSVNVQNISEPIWPTLSGRINWKALDGVTSVHDKNRSEYWLWLPINGEVKNQIAVIYNYKTKAWRVAGGWYPFDSDSNRDLGTSPAVWSATASCPIVGAMGRNIVLSSDANGIVWQESVGYDDDGLPFPAYVMFRPYGSKGIAGENYVTDRAWYVECDLDGATIQGIQLGDGERLDREIDRLNRSGTLNSQTAQKQALLQNAVSSATGTATTTPTFAAPPSWAAAGIAQTFGQRKKLKLSFGRNLTWMQPVIHWRPVPGNGGRGTVYSIQFGEAPKPSGR